MAQPVLMPKQGITVESCLISKWFKKPGDPVAVGDVLFTYETDKSAFDVEAETAGTLLEIFYPDGEEIPVLTNVAAIGRPGEDVSSLRPGVASAGEAASPLPSLPEAEAPQSVPGPAKGEARVSPRARALAARAGVDPAALPGSGPLGRVIERDVAAAARSLTPAAARAGAQGGEGSGIGGRVTVGDLAPAPAEKPAPEAAVPQTAAPKGDFEDEKLPTIRRTIARQMTASLQSMAQLTLHSSFDATEVLRFRAACKADAAWGLASVTVTDLVLYAVVKTLMQSEHRSLNAHLLEDRMRFFRGVHLGLAVDTPRGLMVPTIFDADRLSLKQLSAAAKEAAAACQAGSIDPDRLQGGTFTVSNLGPLGVESFTPVINPPQTAILGLTSVQQRPREEGGQIRLYPAMGLSLTFDHRALDGAPAARFLRDLAGNLNRFGLLLAL